ncbi:MAG: hypothetical protein ACKVH5_09840, partial [Fidelibacterota bacterium]
SQNDSFFISVFIDDNHQHSPGTSISGSNIICKSSHRIFFNIESKLKSNGFRQCIFDINTRNYNK